VTVTDQVNAASRSMVQSLVDKESVNYIEAGSLYGIVTMGRYQLCSLYSIIMPKTHSSKSLLKKVWTAPNLPNKDTPYTFNLTECQLTLFLRFPSSPHILEIND